MFFFKLNYVRYLYIIRIKHPTDNNLEKNIIKSAFLFENTTFIYDEINVSPSVPGISNEFNIIIDKDDCKI